MLEIIKANIEDHKTLSDLTKRSKAYWGYSEEQIKKWAEELTISAAYIQKNQVFKLEVNHEILGYYSYFYKEERIIELDNLFVLPRHIGKGYGNKLMLDFLSKISNLKIESIILYSEPKAELFYQKFGFQTFDKLESSIEGRFLPIMKKKFNE